MTTPDTFDEHATLMKLLELGYEIGLRDEDGDAHRITVVEGALEVDGFWSSEHPRTLREAAGALIARRTQEPE